MLYQPLSAWDQNDDAFMLHRLKGELSLASLEWFEENAEAVSIFSCLVLGTMVALLKAGHIDQTGFLLGDAHLAAFNAESADVIYARFNAYKLE